MRSAFCSLFVVLGLLAKGCMTQRESVILAGAPAKIILDFVSASIY
jgi:hypothetical protein